MAVEVDAEAKMPPAKEGYPDGNNNVPVDVSTTEAAADVPSEEPAPEPLPKTLVHQFMVEETILIFDWDDTMLPSSWVQQQGLRLDAESTILSDQQAELDELADLAAKTINMAKLHGTVVLVTNAEQGWIEMSCEKFMPSLRSVLADVRVLSARTAYEGPSCITPFQWKTQAFANEIERIFPLGKGRKNVLSFGDSPHEREALMSVTADLKNCRTKSLKFVDRPGVNDLRKQHALLTRVFPRIVHHDGNLDLCITPTE